MTCYIYLSSKSLMSFNYLLAVIILPIQVLCRGKVNSIRMAGGRKTTRSATVCCTPRSFLWEMDYLIYFLKNSMMVRHESNESVAQL